MLGSTAGSSLNPGLQNTPYLLHAFFPFLCPRCASLLWGRTSVWSPRIRFSSMTPSATTSATVDLQLATRSWRKLPWLLTYTPGYWSYLRVRLGCVSACRGYRWKCFFCYVTEANLWRDPIWILMFAKCGCRTWIMLTVMKMRALYPDRVWHGGGGAGTEAQWRGEAASGNCSNHPERTPDHSSGWGESRRSHVQVKVQYNLLW